MERTQGSASGGWSLTQYTRMRFGLKAKEILVVTALTVLVVATTSLVHFSQLTRVAVHEALGQADLIAKQIYAHASRSLSRAPGRDPWEVLRTDPELRSLLEASVGYSAHLVYVLIADQTGKVILHGEWGKEGSSATERPPLQQLLSLDPVRGFVALYEPGKVYEVALPVLLDDRPFGSIRLGVSPALLQKELYASMTRGLALAGLALPVGWLVAIGLANLTLKPLRRFTQEMERLRQGEFEVGKDLGRDDEFKELASQLQLLGQQLQSDRLKVLSEKTQLQQVVDRLEDGIIFLSQDGRILFFNRPAEVVVGKPMEQVLGWQLDDMLEPAHPLRPLLERGFGHNVGVRNATMTLPQNGRFKEFLVSIFSVADAHQAMGVMVLLKDLDSIKTLQSLVRYSAKLTALGRLTSGVAHEVKNPLNAMMIHLELLKEKVDVFPEKAQENVKVIESEIRRLDRVVQGFLKFIRPQELALDPVDLNALLQDIIGLLEAEWKPRDVQFAFQPEAALPLIRADRELLHQACLNILLNSCQAMPSGGTITVATTRWSRELVRVIVRDQGMGIPPEDLDKIFRLYYTTKPGGSGIGLSLAYRIVQQHDGSIDVASAVGRGTTMSVQLPID